MLLGIPWHEETNPDTAYARRRVSVNGKLLGMKNDDVRAIKTGNIGIKKFGSLLGKKRRQSEAAVFRLHNIIRMPRVKLTPDLPTFDL